MSDKFNEFRAQSAQRFREEATLCADAWLRSAGLPTYSEVRAELAKTRKLLEDANRGAERNAHANRLLAQRVASTLEALSKTRLDTASLIAAEYGESAALDFLQRQGLA